MTKLLVPAVMIIMVLLANCDFVEPEVRVNDPPVSYIDSVSPTKVEQGDPISFIGHGTDIDGDIVAYRWRSNLDGEISVAPTFESSKLSIGTHTIYFKVKDNNDEWSKEAYLLLQVVRSGTIPPVIEVFRARPDIILPGGFVILQWDAPGARLVSIDPGIGNVPVQGERTVFPTETLIYTIKAVNEAGSVTKDIKVTISEVEFGTVVLFSIPAEDGHVREDEYVGTSPMLGDNESRLGMQAFLSFDISVIPAGATIESATLDLTKANMSGDPFAGLGLMGIYNDQYGKLDKSDYVVGPAINEIWNTAVHPTQLITTPALARAVQKQLDAGQDRFQLRIQFEKRFYEFRRADYLDLGSGKVPLTLKFKE